MKNLFRSLISKKPPLVQSNQICNHKKVTIPEDQINKSLIFLSKDHCKTCSQHMCHICSDTHVTQHCQLSLGVNRDFGQGIQKDFNYGYLMKVNLNNIKCICGKQLEYHNLNHAICAGCGLASCSDQCHHQWEKQGNCTYHQNFFEPDYKYNIRSIRFANILNIRNSKIKRWNLAQKTSLSFISCYASKVNDYVYLQRGFRNYGRPQPELLARFQKVPFGLDFTTHIQRMCNCACSSCQDREIHSVGNCEYQCTHSIADQLDTYGLQEEYHKQCDCTCEFCSSGIVVDSHRKLDCLQHCYKSELKNLYEMS